MERHYEITEQTTFVKNIFNKEDEKMVEHLLRKMIGVGDDVELDDNLKETPHRFLKMWTELTSGYRENPKSYLDKCFPVNSPNMAEDSVDFNEETTESRYHNGIVLVATDARSNCIHHLQPMHGRVWVAYIPNQKVVGLSKIVRMVKGYGKTLNLQEGWNNQIADAIMEKLDALGCLVFSEMVHECVCARGASEQTATTSVVTVRGVFTESHVKDEAMQLIQSTRLKCC